MGVFYSFIAAKQALRWATKPASGKRHWNRCLLVVLKLGYLSYCAPLSKYLAGSFLDILATISLPALYSALRARSLDRSFFFSAAAVFDAAAAVFVADAFFADDDEDDFGRFAEADREDAEAEEEGLRFLPPADVVAVGAPCDPPQERALVVVAVAVGVRAFGRRQRVRRGGKVKVCAWSSWAAGFRKVDRFQKRKGPVGGARCRGVVGVLLRMCSRRMEWKFSTISIIIPRTSGRWIDTQLPACCVPQIDR